MVCSVRAASVSARRRRLFLSSPPPAPLAVLDLSQAGERQAQAVVRRLSSGRGAIWRLLGMARQGSTLLCAVRWLKPRHAVAPYSLAEVSLTEPALCWRSYPTADAAHQEMDRRCAKVQTAGEAP